jgi:Transposase IS116/IS110/IS902 family
MPGAGRAAADVRRAAQQQCGAVAQRTDTILAALRSPQLGRPPALTAAYSATARSLIAVIATLNEQVRVLQGQAEAHFGQHPDAEIYLSQPGPGAISGARVLGVFGDDPQSYACAKVRRNYAATSPITRASGKKKIVARFVHNERLINALMIQALAALRISPGARTFYDDLRARGIEHNDALRRLANRLVGILHRCLKTRTCYDEATAWCHRQHARQSPVAA